MMGAVNKDSVLGISLLLSVVSLVLLFSVTWYFQSSQNTQQQQAARDKATLLKLQVDIYNTYSCSIDSIIIGK